MEYWQKNICELSACNCIKKRIQQRYFPVNIAKFLRTTFLYNTSGGCFLILHVKTKFQNLIWPLRVLTYNSDWLRRNFCEGTKTVDVFHHLSMVLWNNMSVASSNLPSGIRRCNQNRKVPGSNLTWCEAPGDLWLYYTKTQWYIG